MAAKLGGGGSAGHELGQLLQGMGELLVSKEAPGQVCFLSGLGMVVGMGYLGHMLLELLVKVKSGARTRLDRLFFGFEVIKNTGCMSMHVLGSSFERLALFTSGSSVCVQSTSWWVLFQSFSLPSTSLLFLDQTNRAH